MIQKGHWWMTKRSWNKRSFSTTTEREPSPSASSENLVSWHLDEATKVGTITLNSPKTFNALTVEMGQSFQALVRNLQQDALRDPTAPLHAIVLQGAGDQAFSAGGNFPWLKSLKDNPVHINVDHMLDFYNSLLCIRTLDVPTIAALSGPAMGAGACLALACDMRVAQQDAPAVLGFPFSRLGIHSGMGGSWLLQHAGISKAMMHEILFTAKTLSATEAYELGLVNRTAENAKEGAQQLANEVSRQHPVAIRTMVRTMRGFDEGLQSTLQREAYAQGMFYVLILPICLKRF